MDKKKYDIKDRTLALAIRIIKFIKKFPKDTASFTIGGQIARSGTSIGANIEEADGASTRNDFFHKMTIARKEARETRYWLRVIKGVDMLNNPSNLKELSELESECDEIVKILSSIIGKRTEH